MDLVSRLELVDSVIADRHREAGDHSLGRLAGEGGRLAAACRPTLADRLSVVFGRSTQPAT